MHLVMTPFLYGFAGTPPDCRGPLPVHCSSSQFRQVPMAILVGWGDRAARPGTPTIPLNCSSQWLPSLDGRLAKASSNQRSAQPPRNRARAPHPKKPIQSPRNRVCVSAEPVANPSMAWLERSEPQQFHTSEFHPLPVRPAPSMLHKKGPGRAAKQKSPATRMLRRVFAGPPI